MERIIRSTGIPIFSLHSAPKLIHSTPVVGETGNSSTALQMLLAEPPSVFARIFLLGSMLFFSLFLIWVWSIKIEQVSRVQAKIIQPQQVSHIINVSWEGNINNEKHRLIPELEGKSELIDLLTKFQILTQNLASIQVNVTTVTTLFSTVPVAMWQPFINPSRSKSITSGDKGLVLMSQLPQSAIESLKTGEKVQISLEPVDDSQSIAGEIIAIAADDLSIVTSPSQMTTLTKVNFHPYQAKPAKITIPNAQEIVNQPVANAPTTTARIIQQKRAIEIFWENLHTPINEEIN